MSDVRLRSLSAADLDDLVMSRIDEAGTMGNPAPARPEGEIRAALADRVAHSGTHHGGELLVGIEEHGRLVGEIQARCPENGMPPGVFELGINLFSGADRSRGVGRRAVALMAARLFDEDGAHRIQAGTDLDNAAMRTVLERLGFHQEGVMRSFMPMPGDEPHDYALYALTHRDYEEVKTEWT